MEAVNLLKTAEVENVDRQQTLLILPADYVKRFPQAHAVVFKELGRDTLVLTIVGPHDRAYNRPYKLVQNHGASQVSVPRTWLRNAGARQGDRLDIYNTISPEHLVVKLRKAVVT